MCFLVEAVKSCSDWLRYVNIADKMEESDWLMGLQWDILLAAQTFIFKTKLMRPVSKVKKAKKWKLNILNSCDERQVMTTVKSREEIRFLALLAKTQEKAAHLKSNNNCVTKHLSNSDRDKSEHQVPEDDWRLPKVNVSFLLTVSCS